MSRRTTRSYTLEGGGPFDGKQYVIASDRGFIVLIELDALPAVRPAADAMETVRQMKPRHVYIRTADDRFVYDGLKR